MIKLEKETSHRVVTIEHVNGKILHVFSVHKKYYEKRSEYEINLVAKAGEQEKDLLMIT